MTYVNNKYSNTGNTAEKDDQKILRYADVLLLLAESYARTADPVNALIRLNQVAQNRDASFAGFASAVLITVAPGDFRRIFPIPQAETDVNPSIKVQQNPGYL